ncbi:MAG TPA: DUF72 domain-containing protein [Candidatus Sulfotelmatobacter sp.]|nr:DUF72 domain-containing protein [Candidatus Sulfotelmatobacter sp.]
MRPNPALGHVRIGTSGWHYPHWRGSFYPAGLRPDQMLRWYAEHFDTVEINNSFYRLPSTEALQSWCDQTSSDFHFAMKASRYITHNRKLMQPAESTKRFMLQARELGHRLGPILFQLPPAWHVNTERLEEFLSALPSGRRYACEFRNPTWNVAEVYDILRRHNVAYCIFELGGFHSPIEITADFTYVRLHGPDGPYRGDYPRKSLQAWAKRVESWQHELKQIFVYFDNDQSGYAPKNALELKDLLDLASTRLAV